MNECVRNRIGKFFERWSRRKVLAMQHVGTRDAAPVCPDDATAAEAAPPPFDPASLPPIETINSASDLRAFLAPGVPVELTRAALRRAWVADPVIRDFIEIAENQWDFGKPDGVPGFGSLTLTPDLHRLLVDLCGDLRRSAPLMNWIKRLRRRWSAPGRPSWI